MRNYILIVCILTTFAYQAFVGLVGFGSLMLCVPCVNWQRQDQYRSIIRQYRRISTVNISCTLHTDTNQVVQILVSVRMKSTRYQDMQCIPTKMHASTYENTFSLDTYQYLPQYIL